MSAEEKFRLEMLVRDSNIVELVTFGDLDEEETAWDQPCKFGHRVDGHAVYCHNNTWPNAPRKCRRTWYTGGRVVDEDCRGFVPNPTLSPARGRRSFARERASLAGSRRPAMSHADVDTSRAIQACQYVQAAIEHSTPKNAKRIERLLKLLRADLTQAERDELDGVGLPF